MTAVDAAKHRSLLQWFPHLRRGSYRHTSPPTSGYNCFAWAVGETHRRWDPTAPRNERNYWPTDSRSTTLSDAVAAFMAVGFREVDLPRPGPGAQTIMLYAADGHITHAARLLETGRWTSKLGPDIDVEHDTVQLLAGGAYGQPAVLLTRSIS